MVRGSRPQKEYMCMTPYEKFRQENIDLSPLGLEPTGDMEAGSFCTPAGAEIFGRTGVDGIHFCFVEGCGDMVFAVSPMNPPGEYVKPVANSFEGFLRLLAACGSTAAIEQAWMWTRGEFDAYLETYPPGEDQLEVLRLLKIRLCIAAMKDPYEYMRNVQTSFDYAALPFSEEYYELTAADGPKPQAEPVLSDWEVYFEHGFGSDSSDSSAPGKEIAVDRTFSWGGRTWYIPAIYSCKEGIVMDFCIETDPAALRAYAKRYGAQENRSRNFTLEELELRDAQNPMNICFTPTIRTDGATLRYTSGCSCVWDPTYGPDEAGRLDPDSKRFLEHYGLDPEQGWVFWRYSFPWSASAPESTRLSDSLSLLLEQDRAPVPGLRFTVYGAGDSVEFVHPVTGRLHTLTVMEYEAGEINPGGLPEGWEYPTWYAAMAFAVEPDVAREELLVRDCDKGDSPRVNPQIQPWATIGGDGPEAACAIGIIGGADGPTALATTAGMPGHLRSACSSLRFEQPVSVEWRIVFMEKTLEDKELELALPQV